jgi:hypothetical protein
MLRLGTYLMMATLAAGPANAAVVTYGSTTTDPAADNSGSYVTVRNLWESLTTGLQTVDFAAVPLYTYTGSGYFTYDTATGTPGRTPYGGQYSTIPSSADQVQVFQIRAGDLPYSQISEGSPMPLGTNAFVSQGNNSPMRIVLPTATGVNSLALDLYTLSGSAGIQVGLYASDNTQLGSYTIYPTGTSQAAFFGVTSDTAISYVTLSSWNQLALTQLDFGQAGSPLSETPESATLGYVGLGIAALFLGSKRKLVRKRQ